MMQPEGTDAPLPSHEPCPLRVCYIHVTGIPWAFISAQTAAWGQPSALPQSVHMPALAGRELWAGPAPASARPASPAVLSGRLVFQAQCCSLLDPHTEAVRSWNRVCCDSIFSPYPWQRPEHSRHLGALPCVLGAA